jgi:hypothetical protein
VVAGLLVGEGIARLRGDRLCIDRPGTVYQADVRFGWTLVPGLRGWVTRCTGTPLPAVPVEVNSRGLRDRERPYAKPAETARVVLLGGNVAEGLAVPEQAMLARLLEERADRRQGRRLDVVNAALGGWSLDNDLLWFRAEGARYAPDLVLVLLNPVAELVSIFPPKGLRVPAKPMFSLAAGRLVLHPAPAPEPAPAAARDGVLGHVALYRVASRTPTRVGAPVGWIEAEPGDPPEERVRGATLARALLEALRDESAAAGARLVAVIAPAGYGGAAGDVLGAEEEMRTIVRDLGIPAIDLGPAFRWFREQTGRSGYVPGTARWNRDGHFIASQGIWTFLGNEHLVPAGVVAVAARGGKLAKPERFPAKLWRTRHSLFATFVQYGLVAVCVLWTGAVLPAPARDWLLVALSVGAVAFLATPASTGGAGLRSPSTPRSSSCRATPSPRRSCSSSGCSSSCRSCGRPAGRRATRRRPTSTSRPRRASRSSASGRTPGTAATARRATPSASTWPPCSSSRRS